MRLRVRAAAALVLWALVAAGAAAGPSQGPPGRCALAHYRALEPRVLAAVKALRDRYDEETLSWRPRNCSFRPRRAHPPPWSCARLRLVARGIAEAQAVLSGLWSPELVPDCGRTLELLAAVERDLGACLQMLHPSPSRKKPRPRKKHPKAQRQDSPRCHQAKVVFGLLRLLTWDLRLVAQEGPCL
ncbi:interferon lambda-4-like [Suncus etruscus]|uniref:interferon lambda-4-like n=1 Tax=Suncus etruscus TaxID=109475 RepID=UPI00210FDE97|nr:interferon lambda-4-like [Suncus etruscus]